MKIRQSPRSCQGQLKVSEKSILTCIINYLEVKRIFHWRNNVGATQIRAGYFCSFGSKGSPDIFCVINGQLIGLEAKTLKAKQSEDQKIWQKNLEEAGGKYYIVHSLDDMVTIFDK